MAGSSNSSNEWQVASGSKRQQQSQLDRIMPKNECKRSFQLEIEMEIKFAADECEQEKEGGGEVDSGSICGIIFNCLLPHGIGFVAVALFCYAFNLPKLPFAAEQAEEEPSRAAAAAGVTTRRPQWQR